MTLRTWFAVLCSTVCLLAKAQPYQQRINALRDRLPLLGDTARIDAVADLCNLYGSSSNYEHYDSVELFALPAIAEARRMNYRDGLCRLLYYYGSNLNKYDAHEAEIRLREALSLAKTDSMIFRCHAGLIRSFHFQAKYQAALELLQEKNRLMGKLKDSDVWFTYIEVVNIYQEMGFYDSAFDNARAWNRLARQRGDTSAIIGSVLGLVQILIELGDLISAPRLLKEIAPLLPADSLSKLWITRHFHILWYDYYLNRDQLDSARWHLGKAAQGYPTAVTYQYRFGRILEKQGLYDTALAHFLRVLPLQERLSGGYQFGYTLWHIGSLYLKKGDPAAAYRYASQVLQLADRFEARRFRLDAYHLMYEVCDSLGRQKQALEHLKAYVLLQDSLFSDKLRGRIYEFNRELEEERNKARLQTLENEKALGHERLHRNRQLMFFLAAGLILSLAGGIVVVKNAALKRKNERLAAQQRQYELQQKAAEHEMRALRSQMNPHFIFNCLSSINSLILKGQTDEASDYLTRFSQLMRMVMKNSRMSFIPLGEELAMLRLYLDMEKLRFGDLLQYGISVDPSIDPDSWQVPSLLLQPFCENAIRHGLMPKSGGGKLEIRIDRDKDRLHCIITDNGIGYSRSGGNQTEENHWNQSMGLRITAERLAGLQDLTGDSSSFEIQDIRDSDGNIAGTRVDLFIATDNVPDHH